ncbi:MAG: tRNA(Met) cytidine acetyltransferase [Gammaproteobacteria bacterium]|nr:MAG: tRNA(Met) cytidine acetyltransferase [Gammaproteobacteria bacterium]
MGNWTRPLSSGRSESARMSDSSPGMAYLHERCSGRRGKKLNSWAKDAGPSRVDMRRGEAARNMPRQACRVEIREGREPGAVRDWMERLRRRGWRPAWIRSGEPGAGRECLGRTLDALVFDARAGFDPDAFARACGAVRGGGVFVLLTPPLDSWPACPDVVCDRIDAWGREARRRAFVPRLVRLLQETGVFLQLAPEALPDPVGSVDEPWRLTRDQRRALDRLEALVDPANGACGRCEGASPGVLDGPAGTPPRVPVLIAGRGRGKSTVLGLWAAALRGRGAQVLVTSWSRDAARTLLETAASRGQPLPFRPPERVAGQGLPREAWLFVDEAAAIPVARLRALLCHPRCVLAGTVEGYEGTGRGFLHRLLALLGERADRIRLDTPVRWCRGDPLERFQERLLLCEPSTRREEIPAPPAVSRVGRLHSAELPRERLVEDERLLRGVFGLLRDAHYRTRPLDLRLLLDAPNVRLFGTWEGRSLLAVALLLEEGGLPGPLAQAVAAGRRRVRGHLLPQSLAFHLARPEGAGLRGWRFSRIAVVPERQGQGLGTALVARVREQARQRGCDWLGVSFGATPGLVRFWYRSRFVPLRLGARREAASGALPLLMLSPLGEAARALTAELFLRFHRALPLQLPFLAHPPGPALRALLSPLPFGLDLARPGTFDARDRREVAGFAATGNLHDALPALLRWYRTLEEPLPHFEALLACRDAARAAARCGLPGRRAWLRALQAEVARRAPSPVDRPPVPASTLVDPAGSALLPAADTPCR